MKPPHAGAPEEFRRREERERKGIRLSQKPGSMVVLRGKRVTNNVYRMEGEAVTGSKAKSEQQVMTMTMVPCEEEERTAIARDEHFRAWHYRMLFLLALGS